MALNGRAEVSLSDDAASAYDPQPVIGWIEIPQCSSLLPYWDVLSFRSHRREALGNETPLVHHASRRRGCVAARGALRVSIVSLRLATMVRFV
ncbi:MAG: hypothetical protein WBZ35_04040, partial [Pseudolabrys sp.]